jgi:hypothetical protein
MNNETMAINTSNKIVNKNKRINCNNMWEKKQEELLNRG